MNKIGMYRKLIVAALGVVATYLGREFTPDEVSAIVELAIAGITLVAIYAAPNDQPE